MAQQRLGDQFAGDLYQQMQRQRPPPNYPTYPTAVPPGSSYGKAFPQNGTYMHGGMDYQPPAATQVPGRPMDYTPPPRSGPGTYMQGGMDRNAVPDLRGAPPNSPPAISLYIGPDGVPRWGGGQRPDSAPPLPSLPAQPLPGAYDAGPPQGMPYGGYDAGPQGIDNNPGLLDRLRMFLR